MRDFFINSLEILVGVIVVVLAIAVLGGAAMASFGGDMMGPGGMSGGPLAGLAILIGGGLYVIFIGGFLYMGIGIYQNTKRTAEAMERMAGK